MVYTKQILIFTIGIKTGNTDKMECYIDFLNKDKGFKKDRKDFKTYAEAVEWAKAVFEKFDPDMISYY